MRLPFIALLCITLAHLFCSEVSCQEEPLKQGIVNGAFDLSAKLNQVLYKSAQQAGNVLFSPINIYSALALVHLGADGNTRDEIANLLGLPKDSSEIQQTHETLSQLLKNIENTTPIRQYVRGAWQDAKSSDINIANGIFVQNGVDLIPSYISQVQSYYKSQVSNVDFAKESSKATDAVNQFVSKSTNGRIPQLFASPISSDTRALLATSLYFKASWDNEFAEYAVKEENFDTGSGNSLTKMMAKTEEVLYINLRELQLEAISLPYAGGDASMFFVLPYQNQTLDNVVSSLNGTYLQQIVKHSKSKYVNFKIPQMKYKWTNKIKDQLVELGVKELFSENAKLNNMVKNMLLKVSDVTHAAEIEVNERGTEASAVSVIEFEYYSGKNYPKPVNFHVNRPFLFAIHHQKTNTVLFMGAVHNPKGI